MRRHFVLSLFVVFILVGVPASAQTVIETVSPFEVSSDGYDPKVTTLPNGDFVVVWEEYSYVTASKVSGGVPSEFTVFNTYYSYPAGVDVDSDASGNFWVVWGMFNDVHGQRYNASASALQSMSVGAYTAFSPQIGVAKSSGDFVIAYDDFPYTKAAGYDSDASPANFSPFNAANTTDSRLAVDPSGNFVVVWEGDGYLAASTFNAVGVPQQVSPPYHFEVATLDYPADFDVASSGTGQFVVVWAEQVFQGGKSGVAPGGPGNVMAQRIGLAAPSGSPFVVANPSSGYAYDPRVAANSSYFVTVWDEGSYGMSLKSRDEASRSPFYGELYYQAMTLGGTPTPIGGPGAVTSFGNNHDVSLNADGHFSVTWEAFSVHAGQWQITDDEVCPTPVAVTLVSPADGAEFEVGETIRFEWSPVPDAFRYELWSSVNGAPAQYRGATVNTFLDRPIQEGTTVWYVITTYGSGCPTSTSSSRTVKTKVIEPPPPGPCGLSAETIPSIVGEATTGETYTLSWEKLEGAAAYKVQESSQLNFAGSALISDQIVDGLSVTFSHPNLSAPTPFYYRVAGIVECEDGDKVGPYSVIVRVVGLPKPQPSSINPQVVTEFGNEDFVETFLFIPGFGESSRTTAEASFQANSNEPWLTVDPTSGTLPPEGRTVKLLADPKELGVGANTATVTVTRDDGLGKSTSGTTTTSVPVAVSLVTPVTPIPKTAGPPENSLIIPAVANVTGINSKWFSDVKVTNRSGQLINYQLNFSATDQSGTVEGKQTRVSIRPGQTVALDDVVRQWYGLGDLADGTNGQLEIRPINFAGKVGPEAAPMLATVASSRTYTKGENSLASYGQFIPAVPFSSFLKAGVQDAVLLMQQVSQTASLRTNFGLVEGAGKEVNVLMTVHDKQGVKIGEFPVALKAGEHKQLNSLLALNGITLEDGRMTVQIVSGEGAVTAYASVVASGTGDPALVPGVDPSSFSAKKYVLPGVADLRIGAANWRSDVRIFNPNPNTETVNLFFYPQGETTPLGPVEIEIQSGHVEVLPGVVESLFGQQDLGGALHIVPITGQETSLVVSGETYDISELGKYGQFIPAATEANAIGVGSPGLEIMQVESSAQFRTNLGIAELTGQSATVQIQLTVPNSLIAPTKTVTIEGNEFEQLNGIVKDMAGGRDVYNGRLTVRVVGGAGRITAYGSTVDNQTQDATYSAGQ